MPLTEPISAADVRALLARHRVQVYKIAPAVGIHPVNLSLILNERRALPPDLAARLVRAIEQAANVAQTRPA